MGGRPLAVHEYKIYFLLILGAPGVEKTNPVIPICNLGSLKCIRILGGLHPPWIIG